VKPSQYLRAATSLSSALDSQSLARVPLCGRGCPRILEASLESHRHLVAFGHSCDLYCRAILVLHCLVDRYLAGAPLCDRIDALLRLGEVRFGSKADIAYCQADVRFTPKSGHQITVHPSPLYPQKPDVCPQRPRSGHWVAGVPLLSQQLSPVPRHFQIKLVRSICFAACKASAARGSDTQDAIMIP
jgi:hypothetical protein